MNIFYKICVILIIIGGINWGLIGLFSFDAVAWLLGGSASLLSRAVYTVVGIAALCAIPSLFGSEPQTRRAIAQYLLKQLLGTGLKGLRRVVRPVFQEIIAVGAEKAVPLLGLHPLPGVVLRNPLPGGISSPYRAPRTLQKPHFWYIICYKCAHLRAL